MIKAQNLPIALFDSGVGGLTVLKAIHRQMPQESILYFADTARLPYGTRSPETILQFVREIIDWLANQRVKMVIMACNTSSALALETVRAEYDLPILGLILPGARTAVKQGKNIGVIATPATVRSNAYAQAIQEINSTAQVWQIGCPEFVPLIEGNQIESAYTKEVAQEYLYPLLFKGIDTLIYGCTHYRHLEVVLRSILPPSVNIIDPAESIAIATERELGLMGLKNNRPPSPTRFCVTGSVEQFAGLSQRWLGFYPEVEKIHLLESSRIEMTLKSSEGI
ncbi:MAG: glutamate racemase [Xenococcaceae cyanobacterium]